MCNIHSTVLIGDNVKLGKNITVMPYVILEGNLTIGDNTIIYHFACLGTLAEHMDVKEERGLPIIIGKNVIIREQVTVHSPVSTETVIGDESVLYNKSHLGHDVKLGKGTFLSTNSILGGYTRIQENAYLGLDTATHPLTLVGACAIIGSGSSVKRCVPPFSSGFGAPFRWNKINSVGLQRRSQIDPSEWKAVEQILQHPFHTKKELKVVLDRYEDTVSLTAPTVWKQFNLFYEAMKADDFVAKYSGPTKGEGEDLLYDVKVIYQ